MILDKGKSFFLTMIFEDEICPLISEVRVLSGLDSRDWPCKVGVKTIKRRDVKRARCRLNDISVEVVSQHLQIKFKKN